MQPDTTVPGVLSACPDAFIGNATAQARMNASGSIVPSNLALIGATVDVRMRHPQAGVTA
ncbi:hypothetical protein GGQ68_002190 [Sagittula marina]|uniref:Uncharacterized protein n=1 Tax=Sagittula marina TaxID=943940 RepID=A0A7W6DN87_9RHOB|nr:hypothetical protein [Sagittula marina]MBB3985852.1 hypothetical protein [Sagittula marina]